MKRKQNLEIVAGDTAHINVTVTDRAGAKNLSSAAIRWVLWDDITRTAVLAKTVGGGINVPSPLAGQFTITLDPADTIGIQPGKYSHECEVTDAAGNVSTVLDGAVTILESRA